MKKLVAMVLTFLLILTGCSTVKVTKIKDDIKTDNLKFKSEYTKVEEDNLYEYTTYDNIIDTINSGTGIIYFGYPDCNLCKSIVPILNDAAIEKDIKTIMYYNFKEIKDNNTNEYQKLLKILSENIDDEVTDIKAPTILFVKDGKISDIYSSDLNIDELTDENISELHIKFNELIEKLLEEKESSEEVTIDN